MPQVKIPGGFKVISLPDGQAVVKEKYQELLQKEVLPLLGVSGAGVHLDKGRGGVIRFTVNHPEISQIIVRFYKRGGVIAGPILKDCYWGQSRPLTELEVTDHAFNKGLTVPEVLGVVFQPAVLGFYRAALLMREIPEARDLTEYLAGFPAGNRAAWRAIKQVLIKAVVESLVQFHNAGFYHADLNLRNLLVQTGNDGQLKAWIVDLDKAVHYDKLSLEQRLANLARLTRSLVKLRLERIITAADRLRFLKYYWTAAGEKSALTVKPISLYCTAQIRRHRRWWIARGER